MNAEEQQIFHRMEREIDALRSAMCHYDEMIMLLDLIILSRQAESRIQAFQSEHFISDRLPWVLENAKKSRLLAASHHSRSFHEVVPV